jgi:hypothetical protein
MVKALRGLMAVATLCITLASCQALFMGSYSAQLGQATARIDLSGSVPADLATGYDLFILQAQSGWEYVILLASGNFDAGSPHLIVMSPSLEALVSYSYDQLSNDVIPPGTPFQGDFAMPDASGSLVIGNVQFTPSASDRLTPAGKTVALESPSVPVTPFAGPHENLVNFRLDSSNTLRYERYDASWALLGSQAVAVGGPSGLFSLSGVFTDPNDTTADTALLVLEEETGNGSVTHFVQVSKAALSAGLASPILGNPAYPSVSKTNLDSRSISLTRDGLSAYQYNTRSWIQFTMDASDSVSSLYVGERGSATTTAFSLGGGYYCTWDPATRVLTRYEKWWQK